eukprot:scaffold137042_cov27-Prasinocladus_malaysianus.AAC.1
MTRIIERRTKRYRTPYRMGYCRYGSRKAAPRPLGPGPWPGTRTVVAKSTTCRSRLETCELRCAPASGAIWTGRVKAQERNVGTSTSTRTE